MIAARACSFPLLALLCLAFTTAIAAADPPTDQKRQQFRRLIEWADKDGDGRLSAEERADLRKLIEDLRSRRHEPLPQTVFPGRTDLYKLSPGEHERTVIESFDLVDADRDKAIPLRITIPDGQDPAPVIIFCHGALGSKDGSQPLVSHWTSHGYIVIQPTFGDSLSTLTPAERKRFRSLGELVNSPRVLGQWDDRPRDVSHVIDSLDHLAARIEALQGRIDADRIAVAGHSFGAHTTMLIAGLQLQPPGDVPVPDFRDDRVRATVMISPQGPGKLITTDAYAALQGPMLMITGDNDGTPIRGREKLAGPWRRQAFDHARPGDRYLLWIVDAHHNFGGISGANANWPGAGPEAIDHVLYVKSTTQAFFDAYLKADAQARRYLNSDQLETRTEGKARLTAR